MVCPNISTGSSPKRGRARSRLWRACFALGLGLAVPAFGQNDPLAPERAFRFTARALNPQTIEAKFAIADGYYLYRDKIHFSLEPPSASLGVPSLPEGKVKEDQFFGKVQTYRGSVIVTLTLKEPPSDHKVVLEAQSQGCADVGICYPPQTQRVTVALPAASSAPSRPGALPRKSWLN
jgi:thiol:disulfide interchange protein DsbD